SNPVLLSHHQQPSSSCEPSLASSAEPQPSTKDPPSAQPAPSSPSLRRSSGKKKRPPSKRRTESSANSPSPAKPSKLTLFSTEQTPVTRWPAASRASVNRLVIGARELPSDLLVSPSRRNSASPGLSERGHSMSDLPVESAPRPIDPPDRGESMGDLNLETLSSASSASVASSIASSQPT
ncbi:MAG: hypothetical protein Q8P67_26825, partial [archaeon]|nr:hypothetical protein [archaeon]